jgi:hypothetical protein
LVRLGKVRRLRVRFSVILSKNRQYIFKVEKIKKCWQCSILTWFVFPTTLSVCFFDDIISFFSNDVVHLFIMHDIIPKWDFRHYYSHPFSQVGLNIFDLSYPLGSVKLILMFKTSWMKPNIKRFHQNMPLSSSIFWTVADHMLSSDQLELHWSRNQESTLLSQNGFKTAFFHSFENDKVVKFKLVNIIVSWLDRIDCRF